MKNTLGLRAVLCSALFLSSCANTKSIYRKHAIDHRGQTELVDAKQRAIIVVPNYAEMVESSDEQGYPVTKIRRKAGDPWYRVCAEPSPDVFSIYALALAAEGNVQSDPAGGGKTDIAAQLALTSGETGSTIERTQTINLMRESMYRTCERYLSGAIGPDTLVTQAARDQRAMVAFLAIEQLTGVVKRQPTILDSTTKATLTAANKTLIDRRIKESEAVDKAKEDADAAKADADAKQSAFSQLHAGKCETIINTADPEIPETKTATEQKKTEKIEKPNGETTTVIVEPVAPSVPDTSGKDEAEAFLAKKTECKAAQTLVTSTKATSETKKEALKSAEKALVETTELLKALGYNALTAEASGSGTGDKGSQARAIAEVTAVAKVVEAITLSAFSDQSEIVFACTKILTDSGSPAPAILESCMRIIEKQAAVNLNQQSDSDETFRDIFAKIDEMIDEGVFDTPDYIPVRSQASRTHLSQEQKDQLSELENQFSECKLTSELFQQNPELSNYFEDGTLSSEALEHGPIDGWDQGDELSTLHNYCENQAGE